MIEILKIKYLQVAFLLLAIGLCFTSCQEENVAIATPNPEATLTANTMLPRLMQRIALLDGSTDNFIDNANCFLVDLPVTVSVNGTTVVVNSTNDYSAIVELLNQSNDTSVAITYPITIILSDYTEIIIENQAALQSQITNCAGPNQPDIDIECIDFQYPFSIAIFDVNFDVTETVTIENDEALYFFLETLSDGIVASINYPINLIQADGTIISVDSNSALQTAIATAENTCDEDDDNNYNDADCTQALVTENLTDCFWRITNLDGNTQLIYEFYFNTDGSFTFSTEPTSTDVFQGNWQVTTAQVQTLFLRIEDINGTFQLYTINITVEDCCTNTTVLTNDLILYMPFANETKDLVSNWESTGNHTYVSDRAGNATCAMAFNGNETVEIPVTTANQIIQGDAFSVSLWFKMQNTNPANYEILFQKGATVSEGFQISVFDLNTPVFSDADSGYGLWDDPWNMDANLPNDTTNWHHLVLTVDENNTVRLYRDGIQRNADENSTINIGNAALMNYMLGNGFEGHLDDIRVYKVALNPNDVSTLFALDADCNVCL